MPEDTKPFVFDKDKVTAKLNAVKAALKSYEGKPGYNPYAYYILLENRLNAEETTKKLSDEIFALDEKYVPNAPGKTAAFNRANPGLVKPQADGNSHNMGQIVKPGQS